MKIIISDDVKIAITDIFNYSLNISSKYARKTIDSIYETIFNIKHAPYIGRYVPELSDKSYRERIYKDYRIIYYVSEMEQTVYIQYIFCGKQNSNLFFEVHKNELYKFLNQIIN